MEVCVGEGGRWFLWFGSLRQKGKEGRYVAVYCVMSVVQIKLCGLEKKKVASTPKIHLSQKLCDLKK